MATLLKSCSVFDCNGSAAHSDGGRLGLCKQHYLHRADRPLCSIPGCDKRLCARGYCKSHYNRFVTYGDPLAGRTPKGAPAKWLLAHVNFDEDRCLIWPFGIYCEGRGSIWVDGKPEYAHRYMCRLAHGEPPAPDHETAHSCGNGHLGCVNPKHLRWATRSDNCNDRTLHGTQNRGERCGNAKLTEADVLAIRATKGIEPYAAVAARFGVSTTTIGSIHRRRLWGWLD